MNLDSKRVLVTGGTGFIGSNLANTLAESNDVVVVDDGYLGTEENLDPEIEYHERSVLDDNLPTDVDVVFHLAALSSYAMHEEDPARGARVNVEGFVNTVDQARKDGCDTVVYASTSSIYGDMTEPSPVDMDVTVNTGYEASKMAREKYAEYFHNHYGLNTAGMRFFSVYQGYGGAEEHKGEYANVIAQFADDLANGESPVLYGDGTQTRDFTHVRDIVRGLITAAEHRLQGVYNLGTGRQVSFNELVEMLNDELGTDVAPSYVENPIPESVYVHDTMADTSAIREATGWEAEIPLEEGIREVCSQYLDDEPAAGVTVR
ncbi:NAD-dependent epimerase/dehydratase family protein [Halopelagius longus]|uniref:NAD-dependent epimerase/dehydratase family protein n=1 Tax=Halopelagius longus TaxID=1236180 RepID=A0A1H1FJQ0_9EURY|nr:NAD-dependent epimerase/dehydratase family protein [Halopelagius longus]RDI70072.1 NAD-dependent epimerase/dehydratase family protein [Halopelagius longus]SDR01074.1 UDP-glucose 4-epimerase [Halopelagius longus]